MHTLAQLRAGELAGCTRLDLSADLTELPPEVFDLADSLEVLNLTGNRLSALPKDLPRLKKLKVLFCSDNAFTRVPEVVGACPALSMVGFKANQISEVPADGLPPRLRWLILTDNQITTLPERLGNCPDLEKVALAGNRLSALPEALQQCQQLGLLRLSANAFGKLPSWLLQLPRLAWLALGGNPWGAEREAAVLAQGQVLTDVLTAHWSDLRLGAVLGQGASGVIQAAHWAAGPAALQDLAVKVFKGAVTSDGWPRSEWAASLAAGQHPQLLAARGRLAGHPQGAEGLLMPRIGPQYQTLAGPPSLSSCTRDVYAPGLRLQATQVQSMARGVAAATAHLHARGISHGDLYGHNLLCDAKGQVLLGDFGAATLLPEGLSNAERQAIEAIEVRAFGYLLEELLAHCDAPAMPCLALRDACLQPEVAARPRFADIAAQLAA